MTNDVAIQVKNVTKTYKLYENHADRVKEFFHPFRRKYHRNFNAIGNIEFDVKKGECVGIIGRNGSGKSTLLQIICGILKPTYGAVEINGRISALIELGAGFNPEFSGYHNVYIYAAILGLTLDEINERFDDIVKFADIGDFLKQPVKTYSSGMVVRLAFAVIANINSDILVIDEALAVGDAYFAQKCMRFLRNFIKKNTLLFVSHDSAAIRNLCDRAIMMDKGRIKFDGKAKIVTENYLSALYESNQGKSCTLKKCNFSDENLTDNYKDMRLKFINNTIYRNDIELFSFQPDSQSFGKGGASIISVKILDEDRNPLKWVVGGENVILNIRCKIRSNLESPIVGFFIKDRLGQTLFGDNTFLTYQKKPIKAIIGQLLQAEFTFIMPLLPIGDYAITVAIADGMQEDHVQHQWFHDAVIFKSHTSSVCQGLIGVPMKRINLSIVDS
jgi:lipopolysaccharide transport system ATP-binding protein